MVIFVILLCAAPVSYAQTTLEPILARSFGTTLFRMEMTVPTAGTDVGLPANSEYVGRSELEYPLDVFMTGLRFRREFSMAGNRRAGWVLAAWTNISQPTSRMMDSDWIGVQSQSGTATSTILFKFSYTESRSDLRWYGGEAGFDLGRYALFGKPVRYGLAIRYDHFALRMFGVQGWQRLPGESTVAVNDYPDQLVLTYALTRFVPRLYTDVLLVDNGRISWKVILSGSPATVAMDHDDHVLRNKESDTFAFGFGIGPSSELSWHLARRADFVASLDLSYLRTKGKMDQIFYGDDPFTPEDETGLRFNNVENRIIGLAGGLTLGIRFLL